MKLERAATTLPAHGWQLLPLRFHRIDADSVVLTNLVGEHVFVTPDELSTVVNGTCVDQELLARLRAAHLIQVPGETLPAELLAIKLRTRMRRLPDSTGLHIFVVTLRCEHTCRYCQVSRQSAAKNEFDMTEETARRALELAFRSPSPQLKIELQGGEPLLNFPLVRWITAILVVNSRHAAGMLDLGRLGGHDLARGRSSPPSRPRNRVCHVHAACRLAGAGSADRRGDRRQVLR